MNLGNIENDQQLKELVMSKRDMKRSDAIRLKCLSCQCYNIRSIAKCKNIGCPLYQFRKGYAK